MEKLPVPLISIRLASCASDTEGPAMNQSKVPVFSEAEWENCGCISRTELGRFAWSGDVGPTSLQPASAKQATRETRNAHFITLPSFRTIRCGSLPRLRESPDEGRDSLKMGAGGERARRAPSLASNGRSGLILGKVSTSASSRSKPWQSTACVTEGRGVPRLPAAPARSSLTLYLGTGSRGQGSHVGALSGSAKAAPSAAGCWRNASVRRA
jgi:hypothetical protein